MATESLKCYKSQVIGQFRAKRIQEETKWSRYGIDKLNGSAWNKDELP
jgi:hypothetical protein